MTARNRPGGRQRELYPPPVARAHALARQAVFPLTREEAGPGRPSACLPGVGRFLAMLAAGCTGGARGPRAEVVTDRRRRQHS